MSETSLEVVGFTSFFDFVHELIKIDYSIAEKVIEYTEHEIIKYEYHYWNIRSCFTWSKTKEGIIYWLEVNTLINLYLKG